jgi:hypothetical protein
MDRKKILGAVLGLLLLTSIVGANLVMASNRQNAATHVRQEESTDADDDNLECPAQGLPACKGQMNDEKSEGPEGDEADESEGPENEADDANEADEADDDGDKAGDDSGPDDGDEGPGNEAKGVKR